MRNLPIVPCRSLVSGPPTNGVQQMLSPLRRMTVRLSQIISDSCTSSEHLLAIPQSSTSGNWRRLGWETCCVQRNMKVCCLASSDNDKYTRKGNATDILRSQDHGSSSRESPNPRLRSIIVSRTSVVFVLSAQVPSENCLNAD